MSGCFLSLLLLCLILRRALFNERIQCDSSFCNNQGVCYLESGTQKCECVEGVYSGEHCDQKESHCAPDPCQNGGSCHNYTGGYYCECKGNYGGQNCSFQGNLFKKVYFHYNRVVPLNSNQYFLIMVEDPGNVETNVDLYNSAYAIDVFGFPKKGPKFFTKSNNLRSISSHYSIRNSEDIPYESGYYVAVKGKIVELGSFPIILSMSDAKEYDLTFYHVFNILTYKSPKKCFPQISCSKCSMSRQPLRQPIEGFLNVDPVVERSCGTNSHLIFKWTIWNYLGTQMLHTVKRGRNRELHIPPRTLKYTDGTNFFKYYYTLYLEVTETSNDNGMRGNSYFRCYVLVILRPPKAVITGGNYREANAEYIFSISAEESEDENVYPSSSWKLTYSWSCPSKSNKYCEEIIGDGSEVSVPGNTFKVGEKVNFTVEVGASSTTDTDIAWQEITMVDKYRLIVGIICVKNCARRMVNRQDLLHLKADCKTCTYSVDAKNSWKIESPNIGTSQDGRRFILKGDSIPEAQKLIVKVSVTWEGSVGSAAVELILNKPPEGGECTSEPTSGTEHDDIFKLNCKNYKEINHPIIYSFYQGERLLHRTSDAIVKTRLNAGEGVLVKVCDSLHACTSTSVAVQVSEGNSSSQVDNSSSLLAICRNNSLRHVLEAGDRVRGVILIKMASRELQKIKEEQSKRNLALEIILDIKDLFEVTTEVTALQATTALRDITLAVKMHYSLVVAISEVLTVIGKGLIDFATSGEVMSMHWEGCLQITKELSEIMERMFEESEKYPMVHDSENFQAEQNPFYENYPDYGELDFNLISHIENWRESSKGVQLVLHALGTVAAKFMEPEEPKMDLDNSSMNIQFISVDHESIRDVKFKKWGNEIFFSKAALESIVEEIDSSKHGIQGAIMKNNPFWWYPEQFKITSHVILVNIFHEEIRDFNPNFENSLEEYFDLFMSIKEVKPSNQSKPVNKEVSAYVNRTSDLVLYSTKCDSGSVIVYEFTSMDDDLRVLAEVRKKPRYWMMSKDYTVIHKGSNDSKYRIQNMLVDDDVVYMAVIPDNNKSQERVNFKFKTSAYSCGTWNLLHSNWTFRHCLVGEGTTSERIHCRCNHLSSFASKIFVTPNQLVLPKGIAHIGTNYAFLAFVIIFLLLLAVCLLWAAYNDKHFSRHFIIRSKDTKNSYMYVVTVATGNYPSAGTTARVSLELHGEQGNSETYLLFSSRDKTLYQRKTVYAFTVFTSDCLGKLTSITLSHDGTGRYPSWYCSIVRVKDIEQRKEYIFLVQKWLSVIYNEKSVLNVPLSTKGELSQFKFLIREHTASKLATCFLWHLFCNSHTNSILNRKEKTMTFFTAKAVGALIGVIFFGRTTEFNADDERDEYRNFIITLRILFVIMVGMIAAILTLALLTFCFVKAKTRRELEHQLVFAD